MILILGTTMFTNFTYKEETKDVKIIDVVKSPINKNLAIGKALFKSKCAACHHKNMKDDLTGPALGGVTERWSTYPKEDLYNWIRNSSRLIDKKHPKALEIWEEWNYSPMSSFVELSDKEIEAILEYVEM